jgi:SOS response regulatory protein OraA/RecX
MANNDNPFPGIPPTNVDVKDITDTEIDPAAAAFLGALGIAKSGLIEKFFGTRAASMVDSATTITAILTGNWDKVMAMVGALFLAAQGEKNSGFYDLAAAVLEDLTGVPVDAAALKQSTFGSGRLAGMETFGADLYNLLEDELSPKSGDLEEGDAKPAATFLGFLMNFCIRQGNVDAMCEAMPKELGFLSGFRGYGENMAKNLGLGRLARRALQPLVQILVSDPLTFKLQEDFRPKRIGATPAIKKFFRTPEFETQMRKELAQEGYSDERIDDLITDLRPELSEKQLIDYLFRFGDQTTTIGGGTTLTIRQRLAQRGFSAEDVEKQIQLQRPTLKESEIALLFTHGIMDHETAIVQLNKLGYDDDTAQLALQAHSFSHTQTRRLGLGELKKAFHNNVIDLLELKAHLTSQGYSDADIQIITLDLLQPTVGKVRQLSLAEIKAGFKAGALTEAQAHDHLKTLGFSDGDIAIILKTFTPPKAPSTPATPTG